MLVYTTIIQGVPDHRCGLYSGQTKRYIADAAKRIADKVAESNIPIRCMLNRHNFYTIILYSSIVALVQFINIL